MKKSILYKSIIFMLLAALFLTACNKPQESDLGKVDDIDTAYPITIIDSYDNEVVINEMPNRIISVAPSITEIFFALGVEDKLVGRTEYCDYPEEAIKIENIGSLRSPNIEKIVELQPDLIIASTHFEKDVYDKLVELDIKILLLDPKNTFEGVYDNIEKIGQVLNVNDDAKDIVTEIKQRIDVVIDKVEGQTKPEVYYVVGFGEYGDYTAGGGTFINEMIEMAGGLNVAREINGWKYNIERLVEQDPDLLVVSKYNNTKGEIALANGYSELSAVKEGRVYEIDNNILDRQGPRIAEGIEELAKIFHPGLFE